MLEKAIRIGSQWATFEPNHRVTRAKLHLALTSLLLEMGLAPGPRIGALISAVEEWWVAGDFAADRAACLAELERLAKAS